MVLQPIFQPESRTFPTRQSDGMPKEGWHGYDNNNKDMMGLFFAMGPCKSNFFLFSFQQLLIEYTLYREHGIPPTPTP